MLPQRFFLFVLKNNWPSKNANGFNISTSQHLLILNMKSYSRIFEKVAEMISRAVEINTENDRLRLREKEVEEETASKMVQREQLEKERLVIFGLFNMRQMVKWHNWTHRGVKRFKPTRWAKRSLFQKLCCNMKDTCAKYHAFILH